MEAFRELGLGILDRWRRSDFDTAVFPEIAAAALNEAPPSAGVEPMDIVRWVLRAPVLTPQTDVDAKFGQPPITVFHCERFDIDVLFWVDGTTDIHQHAFCGAFHVLSGSSIHGTYCFTPERRYSEQLWTGTLQLRGVELLTKGDVRPIRAGREFVHALFHLDRPSVSVVVRAPWHADQGIQYSYSRAGLAFDRHAQAQSISKAKQVFDLLSAIDHPDFEVIARESVRAADSYLAFRLVSHLAGRFDKHDRYLAFLESIRPSHHGLLETLIRHAEEVRRDRYIIVRRQRVQQPDLRFFLALLLNVPSRPQILEMVRYAYPGREPREAIVGWLTELSKLDAIHSWASATAMANEDAARDLVLDVPLNPAALRALPVLLGGGTDQAEAGTEALRCQTDDSPSKGLTELHSALRRSILLRPLFTSQISDR